MGHDRGRREKISNIDVSIEFKLTLMIFFFWSKHGISKRFEVEKLRRCYDSSTSASFLTFVPTAPEDVEMEDLNYYYANYSRQVLYSHALF